MATLAERDYDVARRREKTAAAQEIGELPPVADPVRRARAVGSFPEFCRSYFPNAYTLPWSDCHERAASKIEQAVLRGGLFAFAMPRASGKTTMCEWAVLWATVCAHRSYVVFVGATERASERRLKNLKTELATNYLLLADFPEVCFPIHALERSTRRCEGQKYLGVPTAIGWKAKQLILPTIGGSQASGSIIDVIGITGEIRGLNHKREDGSIIRPQLAICDDPQTRESAKSPTQSADRASVIAGDVAYLAGPGEPIAVIMPCTVVYQGDMADQLLDREKYPQWQGERTKMVAAFPENAKLWDEYAEIRNNSFRNDGDGSAATDFYRENREAMDAGAEVYWPERFNSDELSAIQHAMNLKLRDEAAFWAECQNEPLATHQAAAVLMKPEDICDKLNRCERGIVPHGLTRLTAFVDVQQSCLFWMAAAWGDGFSGSVVDYGAYPDQGLAYWSLPGIRRTIQMVHAAGGVEAQIYAALGAVCGSLLSRKWRSVDGDELRIERLMIDEGYQAETVQQFCRQSAHAALLKPAKGYGITAGHNPLCEGRPPKGQGERWGMHWKERRVQGNRGIRHVVHDVNWWKTFVFQRLAAPMGDRGCLSLFGTKPNEHRMLADHLTAEAPVETFGRGRAVQEWKAIPGRDNHWLDCLVGCAVAASLQGVSLDEAGGERVRVRRRVRWSEVKAAKAGV